MTTKISKGHGKCSSGDWSFIHQPLNLCPGDLTLYLDLSGLKSMNSEPKPELSQRSNRRQNSMWTLSIFLWLPGSSYHNNLGVKPTLACVYALFFLDHSPLLFTFTLSTYPWIRPSIQTLFLVRPPSFSWKGSNFLAYDISRAHGHALNQQQRIFSNWLYA